MAQMKAHQVEGWLRKPDPAVSAVLLYGPDRGLVSERAKAYAKSVCPDLDDPFSVLRLDGADIESDPGRLLDEVNTVPMFGGDRLIWISAGSSGKKLAEALAAASAEAPDSVRMLVEAGELKKGHALRSSAESAKRAMALPCYGDEGRDLDTLIDTTLQAAGMTITLDARTALKGALGGDRLASRGELEKLVLYARGKAAIDIKDVIASAGDSAGLSMDDVVDSILTGRLDIFDRAFARHVRSGTKPFLLASAAMRQFQALQLMRHDYEQEGKSAAAIVAAQKPPVFFSRKAVVEKAIALWPSDAISRALQRFQSAILDSRRNAVLEEELIRQALLAAGLEAASRARGRG